MSQDSLIHEKHVPTLENMMKQFQFEEAEKYVMQAIPKKDRVKTLHFLTENCTGLLTRIIHVSVYGFYL